MPPDPEMLVKWADGGHRSDQGVDGEDGVATRSENADVDESDGGGACSSPPFPKREVAGGAGTPLTRDPEESGASKDRGVRVAPLELASNADADQDGSSESMHEVSTLWSRVRRAVKDGEVRLGDARANDARARRAVRLT